MQTSAQFQRINAGNAQKIRTAYRITQGVLPVRARRCSAAAASTESGASASLSTGTKSKLLYDGIVFDMDGTLSVAHIDFADMRRRTGKHRPLPDTACRYCCVHAAGMLP
jgi:hypothetical protein